MPDFLVRLSARALIMLYLVLLSFDHEGMSPQRIGTISRTSGSSGSGTTMGTCWEGATL